MERAESSVAGHAQERPAYVFHGSPRGDIAEFTPRVSHGSGEAYGPQVYASDDLATAAMFTANVGRSWSTGSVGGTLYAVIPMSREEFLGRDGGGYIYRLPGETFSTERGRGMGDREWASPVAVTPVDVTYVPSSLDAMVESGVQVYFVTPELYEQMRGSDQPNWMYLKDVESENQRRGMNVRELGELRE
jgi:hypothetical protein